MSLLEQVEKKVLFILKNKLNIKKKISFKLKNFLLLKGVFAKNEWGYRLNAIKKRF